jgi:integrase
LALRQLNLSRNLETGLFLIKMKKIPMTPSFNAANEPFFHTPRSRNTPIKATLQTVEGLPKKLKLFRILGSKYWQLRYFHKGEYLIRSLKTSSLEEARDAARIFFESLNAFEIVDQSDAIDPKQIAVNNQHLLHDLIKEILLEEHQKLKRDEIVRGSYVMTQIRLEGLIFDFFKDKSLKKISSKTLRNFVDLLTSKNLSVSTIQGYIANTRKLLRLLHSKEILPTVPEFPSLKSQPHSRGAFTLTEYSAILKKSKQFRTQTFDDWGKTRAWIPVEYRQMPHEMNWLIRFMIYTFVRPGDIRQIKNKHVEIINGSYKYLRLTLPEVKRHNAPTVSLPAAVEIFKRQHQYQKQRGFGAPDDYVFFPEISNRKFLLGILGWAFNWILKELDIKTGPHGIDRSLYSLRHTAITFRLIYGGNIDLLTLARNARTSVEMIEKFYASTLSAEMNVALIHNKRR